MLEKHRAQLRALDDAATALIANLLKIPPDEPLLIPALEARGLCQADVVMALLRAPPGPPSIAASTVLGQLVHLVRQPCEHPWPRPMPKGPERLLDPDEWWVKWRKRNLWLPCVGDFGVRGDKNHKWKSTRSRTKSVRITMGVTVRELLGFGVSRETIIQAKRKGLLKFSSEVRKRCQK
jgi:hypothetical protein